ncbi:hypothetical protein CHLRE_04g221850v5 [Chlamydomonas reinhardtii]|uniref:Uncharacterized protein n=1 Tax=Chlamydomonas reinhardtii TaxID=3055 RepID=A8ISX0_CHLRE|nr:uncharacterized protein CHLRE_04g221850v5 [Chlamydomonas reinhardtii]PNW84122.1 hypothetical protein CHLRE_04g221850v5 [Chlamydomonas reinhardtii]|eukprot:XP_001692184.1 predicted protein [Chlamydomonas reinhardtii]
MADTEAVKLVAPESPAQGAFRKSPPRLVVPATPVVGDDYLFSPGVETPGHRLAADKLKSEQETLKSESPRQQPGCLSCLKPRS